MTKKLALFIFAMGLSGSYAFAIGHGTDTCSAKCLAQFNTCKANLGQRPVCQTLYEECLLQCTN